MKDIHDLQTLDMFGSTLTITKTPRGRPKTGTALTASERKRREVENRRMRIQSSFDSSFFTARDCLFILTDKQLNVDDELVKQAIIRLAVIKGIELELTD